MTAPTAVPTLHAPGPDPVEGACIPRVTVTCRTYRGRFDYCHLSDAAVRLVVEKRWRCGKHGGERP